MTRFRSVPLSLHFTFTPAVTLLSVSITAKCQHHVWLSIIRLTDEAHTVSAVTLCSFVMMHLKQRDYRWRSKQRDCIQRAAQHMDTWILYPRICRCEASWASYISTVKVQNIPSCVPASFHSNWAKCQHHRRRWAVLQSNKWSALANTLSDVVDSRDVRCSPREGVTACVNKTQPEEVRNM